MELQANIAVTPEQEAEYKRLMAEAQKYLTTDYGKFQGIMRTLANMSKVSK